MNSGNKTLPIGLFDSGVGGISVLAEMARALPRERFLYFADSGNAPYGGKDKEEIKKLSLQAARFLLSKGIKALVVACNTATSVAVETMRAEFDVPVIGMEPAVKPAVEAGPEGSILVMATPVTLREEKFCHLANRFGECREIMPLPCPGLVDLIEEGHTCDDEIKDYLAKLFAPVKLEGATSVVLGCTHYIFIKKCLQEFLGPQFELIDGNDGTVRQLRRVLQAGGLLAETGEGQAKDDETADVDFYTSGRPEKVIPLCRELLEKNIKG